MMRPAEYDLGRALFYVVGVSCDEAEWRIALAPVGSRWKAKHYRNKFHPPDIARSNTLDFAGKAVCQQGLRPLLETPRSEHYAIK